MADQSRINRLADVLRQLSCGHNPDTVRQEARDLLAEFDPTELAQAEQKLADSGLSTEEIQNLCPIHLEILHEKLQQTTMGLPPGHVLHTLIAEHEAILGYLDKLEQTNQAVQDMDRFDPNRPEFNMLQHLAEHLVETERHHQREEEVLFPEIERRGLSEPPTVMRHEHEQLRPLKRTLHELVSDPARIEFPQFQEHLDGLVQPLLHTLRDHILKENQILYPAALKLIDDQGLWEKMRQDCDKIGYCCFTPETH